MLYHCWAEWLDVPPKKKKLNLELFSFDKSKKILKNYKGSLSEAVIEERRSEL